MNRPDKHLWVKVGGRYAQLMSGELRVEDLDDEELSRGQLRSSNGTFVGRHPKVVPQELVAAMRREWLSRAEARLREALLEHGIGTLVALAGDATIDPAVRLRAATAIIERNLGKVPERVSVSSEDPIESLFRSILADPEGLTAPHELSAEEREMLS